MAMVPSLHVLLQHLMRSVQSERERTQIILKKDRQKTQDNVVPVKPFYFSGAFWGDVPGLLEDVRCCSPQSDFRQKNDSPR